MTSPARLVREGFPPLIPTPRAPGRHLSDVTRSLCSGLGDFASDPDAEPPLQLMQLGLTFEWGLTNQLLHHCPNCYMRRWDAEWGVWRTGIEVSRDGISGNIDLICTCSGCDVHPPMTRGVMAVEDVKFTRKSRNQPHDVQQLGTGIVQWAPKWREAWMRLAGYAWVIGARVGRLWISHVFDYSDRFGGGDACCWVWERRWDSEEGERELQTNWDVIVRHERGMAAVAE